jgi:hypothetical protein
LKIRDLIKVYVFIFNRPVIVIVQRITSKNYFWLRAMSYLMFSFLYSNVFICGMKTKASALNSSRQKYAFHLWSYNCAEVEFLTDCSKGSVVYDARQQLEECPFMIEIGTRLLKKVEIKVILWVLYRSVKDTCRFLWQFLLLRWLLGTCYFSLCSFFTCFVFHFDCLSPLFFVCVFVCSMSYGVWESIYFFPLALQPQFRPWPTSMKLSVPFRFSRS